jgi:hypothetical protein
MTWQLFNHWLHGKFIDIVFSDCGLGLVRGRNYCHREKSSTRWKNWSYAVCWLSKSLWGVYWIFAWIVFLAFYSTPRLNPTISPCNHELINLVNFLTDSSFYFHSLKLISLTRLVTALVYLLQRDHFSALPLMRQFLPGLIFVICSFVYLLKLPMVYKDVKKKTVS